MSIFDKKKVIRQYENEYLKQTNPYQYMLLNNDSIEARGIQREGSPLVSMKKDIVILAENWTVTEYEVGNAKEGYYVFQAAGGVTSETEIETLFLESLKETEELYYDLIYCDEDYLEKKSGVRRTPWLKPEWSLDTVLSYPLFGNLFAIKSGLLPSEQFSTYCDKEQQILDVYQMVIDNLSKIKNVTHVIKILYHSLLEEECTDTQIYEEFTMRYLKEDTKEWKRAAKASYGIVSSAGVSISVVIPSKDHADILVRCIESIIIKTKFNIYSGFEIIVIDNGSREEEKSKITHFIEKENRCMIKYLYEPMEFNYSRMCQLGAEEAQGEYLLFLNDDIEAITDGFILKMLEYAAAKHVGAVGAKLYYPDGDIIQHAGVTDLVCGPSHKLATHSDSVTGYFGKNRFNQNVLAVTGACLLVSKEKYFMAGGFCDKMKVGYNDIDLCVTLFEKGFLNVLVNDCVLFHHESLSRGEDSKNDASYERLRNERLLFYDRHAWLKKQCDPFYHPMLLQDSLDYRVNVVADYENRAVRSRVEHALLKLHVCHNVYFQIDATGYERSVTEGVEDAYVIEGWMIKNKSDNRMYDRQLLLIEESSIAAQKQNTLIIEPFDKVRTDVAAVFPDAAHTELSGFVCKIPVSCITRNQVYRVGVRLVSKLTKQKSMMLGDKYVTTRGYFKTEV